MVVNTILNSTQILRVVFIARCFVLRKQCFGNVGACIIRLGEEISILYGKLRRKKYAKLDALKNCLCTEGKVTILPTQEI